MRLENEKSSEFKLNVLTVIKKHIDLSEARVFLFGSRVSGGGDARSDVDVGIESKKPIPVSLLQNVQEDIDQLPMLYKIDLVDFGRVSDDFKNEALQKIEMIWPVED